MKKHKGKRQAWSPDSEFIYAQNRIKKASPENQPTLRAFEEWLREERRLSPATVTLRLGIVTLREGNAEREKTMLVKQIFKGNLTALKTMSSALPSVALKDGGGHS